MSHSLQSDEKSARVSVAQLVTNIRTDGLGMANDLKALALAEVKPMAKHGGIGAGMFGGAGYLGLNAVSLLFMAGGFAFSMIFNKALDWRLLPSLALGFVCMAVLLLLIAGILALIGKKEISHVGPPEQTISEAKQSVETLKTSVQRGKDTVTANQLARADLANVKKQAKDLEKSEF